jgi:hypothetical protein
LDLFEAAPGVGTLVSAFIAAYTDFKRGQYSLGGVDLKDIFTVALQFFNINIVSSSRNFELAFLTKPDSRYNSSKSDRRAGWTPSFLL